MNTFGKNFRVSTYGESHTNGVGSLISFIPAGIKLKPEDFSQDMFRRQAGKAGTTTRQENDAVEILSGVFNGFTTGAPLNLFVRNKDQHSQDYEQIKNNPRPSHADFVAEQKYAGFNDYRGGGMFSGRMTAALVAAGVVAKKVIALHHEINIEAEILSIAGQTNYESCLQEAIKDGDSLGGIIECKATGIPIGIGEPFFDSLESMISHIVFAIPGIKGIEFGAGFSAADMRGSQYNDCYADKSGNTTSNHSGGINGGISNGNGLVFRIVARPTATIQKAQHTYDFSKGEMGDISYNGRHDICFALRLPVVIEAVTAIALADLIISHHLQKI